jgi:hypothetical protein
MNLFSSDNKCQSFPDSKKPNVDPFYPLQKDKKGVCEAFFKFTSAILDKRDFDAILKIIATEAFSFFDASRATLFTRDPDTGVVNIYFSAPHDQQYEKRGLYEEKMIARNAFTQNKMFCLLEPKDFSNFFNYDKREIKISQLLSIPIINIKPSTILLSLVFINKKFVLRDEDLFFLKAVKNILLMAHKTSYLENKYRDKIAMINDSKIKLDRILETLENLSQVQIRLAEEHISKICKKSAMR